MLPCHYPIVLLHGIINLLFCAMFVIGIFHNSLKKLLLQVVKIISAHRKVVYFKVVLNDVTQCRSPYYCLYVDVSRSIPSKEYLSIRLAFIRVDPAEDLR